MLETPAKYNRREPLNSEEIARLLEACQTLPERYIIAMLLETGLRVHELATLRQDNCDFQTGRIVIWGKGSRGRGKKRRLVPITGSTRNLLIMAQFFRKGVASIRTIQRIVQRVATNAGMVKKVTPHVLRHTFAVRALQNGVSLAALKELLGHSDLRTTAIYLNIGQEDAVREYQDRMKERGK